MSQEKVAELVGVSRQAVTKWECDQSAPSTENLFKLAEIFGSSVDMLLESCDQATTAEQIYCLYKMEEEKKQGEMRRKLKRNLLAALIVLGGYLIFYILGRVLWLEFLGENSFVGWLFTARPTGEYSYLYGWLLSSGMLVFSVVVTAIPALFGRFIYALSSFLGFVAGFIAGVLFGPYPAGTAIGHGHYGWAIWGVIFFLSLTVGIVLEILAWRGKLPQMPRKKTE